MTANFPIYLLVMAGVTYLIRMLPLTIFRKDVNVNEYLSQVGTNI